MKVMYGGHQYLLENIDGDRVQPLQFVQRAPFHEPKEGILNQELLRVLINRVEFLDHETPWEGNKEILKHLRLAYVLHEMRAMYRHVEKGELQPEDVVCGDDGHFLLQVADG